MSIFAVCDKCTILLFQKGDKNAFLHLYAHYAPAILGILTLITDNQSQAQKCLNKSFCEIWLQRQSYDPVKERLFTWMVKIAMSCASSSWSQQARRSDQQMQEQMNLVCATDIKSYFHQKEQSEDNRIAICPDPAMDKAIGLLYFKSRSFAKAAEKSGMTVADLIKRMIKSIRQLKQMDPCLTDLPPDPLP